VLRDVAWHEGVLENGEDRLHAVNWYRYLRYLLCRVKHKQ
jgi:hypothetical protein